MKKTNLKETRRHHAFAKVLLRKKKKYRTTWWPLYRFRTDALLLQHGGRFFLWSIKKKQEKKKNNSAAAAWSVRPPGRTVQTREKLYLLWLGNKKSKPNPRGTAWYTATERCSDIALLKGTFTDINKIQNQSPSNFALVESSLSEVLCHTVNYMMLQGRENMLNMRTLCRKPAHKTNTNMHAGFSSYWKAENVNHL